MNKSKITIVLFFFIALSVNTFGQTKTNIFEVIKSGQGSKSIIFIPGFASSGEVWEETKTIFEKDHICYVLTMAGFAGVEPQLNSSFKNWENRIANYIIENKINKPIIIGHSMGGGLALAIAADYPELIEKIIVVDALPCLPALMNPAFKTVEKPDCSAMLNQISSASNEQFYQMQTMSIQRLVADTSKRELVVGWSMKSDRKTFAEMYCDFSNTDLREKIKNIKCPTLILLEEYFKNTKPAIEEQYKNLKTANLQYANKGFHFIMYDDKEWYLEQLSNFIN
jgi:pimeloyl-ACP methyl ester carboxylesterase